MRREPIVAGRLERLLNEHPGADPALTGPANGSIAPGSPLTRRIAVELFEAGLQSRLQDLEARRLKDEGIGFYTIGSSGHEANAVIGALTRPTDPAFLHYRSGGFVMSRSRQIPGVDPIRDTIRSFTAAASDPIAEGRHKVWGSVAGWIPPQTSTIASHLPKAVGTAFAIERARRLGYALDVPEDAIVVCSYGDASANHASALAGINAARYSQRRGARAPVVFVCEDNGLGISVDTPRRWINASFSGLPHLKYVPAEGDIDEVWAAVEEAVGHCRRTRGPVLLHLKTVRLWGHAGSDVEATYRTLPEIETDEERDPIALAGERLAALGAADGPGLGLLLGSALGAPVGSTLGLALGDGEAPIERIGIDNITSRATRSGLVAWALLRDAILRRPKLVSRKGTTKCSASRERTNPGASGSKLW